MEELIKKYREEITEKSKIISEMMEHLMLIFDTVLERKSKLIVELGTGHGKSTHSFIRGAQIVGCPLVSIDIDDRSYVFRDPTIVTDTITIPYFCIRAEDVEFGKTKLSSFLKENNLPDKIDILFIDTDHERGHTKTEIVTYTPFLSENNLIMLHDASMLHLGVYSGLEDLLDRNYDWHTHFVDTANGWKIEHWPNCCGLTFLHRIDLTEPIQMKIAG